jgi:hypothetical protein
LWFLNPGEDLCICHSISPLDLFHLSPYPHISNASKRATTAFPSLQSLLQVYIESSSAQGPLLVETTLCHCNPCSDLFLATAIQWEYWLPPPPPPCRLLANSKNPWLPSTCMQSRRFNDDWATADFAFLDKADAGKTTMLLSLSKLLWSQ